MAFYLYWQANPESHWIPALAQDRDHVVQKHRPPFTTILDLDVDIQPEMTAEELMAVKYKGPLYFDFDSSDIEEVIPQFHKFLGNLKDIGVDLNQVYLYASGGKGFHITVPQEIFMQKPPGTGTAHLPGIYKEMASGLFVDTLDMRVYTARKGRMFRTVNVKRTNDRYKVQLTVQECRELTPESYIELTSEPRGTWQAASPVYTPGLALEFSKAFDKVAKFAKARGKSKVNAELVSKFKGQFPESMRDLMSGQAREGVGFQKIATQLAIAANALGRPEEEFIEACAGLIRDHESDGNRYNTPKKREAELRRMWHYMSQNICYEFSAGGLKAMLPEGHLTPDLGGGGYERDMVEGPTGEWEPETDVEYDQSLLQGLRMNSSGIYRKIEGVDVRVSGVGITKPCELVDLKTGDVVGYEANFFLDGVPKGRKIMDMSAFQSKHRMQGLTLTMGASINLSDVQIGALADVVRLQALKNDGGRVYTVTKEGVDIVTIPGLKAPDNVDIIFAHKLGVISGLGLNYRLKSLYNSAGELGSDIHDAPALENTEEARDVISKFLTLNSATTVAKVLGWHMSTYLSPMIRRAFEQYPLLQIYGPAGAGKSQYADVVMRLHYYMVKPKVFSAGDLTTFALDATLNSSSSIPLVFDEMKPREMPRHVADKLRLAFRGNYNGRTTGKGNVDKSKTANELSVASLENRAPLSFIGEALESQTAIVDRAIIVPMTKEGRKGTANNFDYCMAKREILSRWGRACITGAMNLDYPGLTDSINKHRANIRRAMPERTDIDRPSFNYAVVLVGLDFGQEVLREVFGNVFDARFDELRAALIENIGGAIPQNMAESSKVLSVLSHLSKNGVEDRTKLVLGSDYTYFQVRGVDCVDIKLRPCYDKYRLHIKSIGEEFMFDTFDAFRNALWDHPSIADRNALDNLEFKGDVTTVVYRFDLESLYGKEGVEEFSGISRKNK